MCRSCGRPFTKDNPVSNTVGYEGICCQCGLFQAFDSLERLTFDNRIESAWEAQQEVGDWPNDDDDLDYGRKF